MTRLLSTVFALLFATSAVVAPAAWAQSKAHPQKGSGGSVEAPSWRPAPNEGPRERVVFGDEESGQTAKKSAKGSADDPKPGDAQRPWDAPKTIDEPKTSDDTKADTEYDKTGKGKQVRDKRKYEKSMQ